MFVLLPAGRSWRGGGDARDVVAVVVAAMDVNDAPIYLLDDHHVVVVVVIVVVVSGGGGGGGGGGVVSLEDSGGGVKHLRGTPSHLRDRSLGVRA